MREKAGRGKVLAICGAPVLPRLLGTGGVAEIEDQTHLFVNCGQVEEQRERLLGSLAAIYPGFRTAYSSWNDKERLQALMVVAPEGALQEKGGKATTKTTEAERQCATDAVCRSLDGALGVHPARGRWMRHFTK